MRRNNASSPEGMNKIAGGKQTNVCAAPGYCVRPFQGLEAEAELQLDAAVRARLVAAAAEAEPPGA